MLEDKSIIGFIPTTDFERAKDFYGRKLGLQLVRDDGFALVYKACANMLRIVKVEGLKPQSFTIMGWEVQDMEKTAIALRERGVQFEEYSFIETDKNGIWTAPSGDQVAWFKDPDGNTLSISHRL